MITQIFIPDAGKWFCISFGGVLLTTWFMSRQAARFVTLDVVQRPFSIMDLELPASPTEVVNLIRGIYALPEDGSRTVLSALKGQLSVDFLFMPLAYGSIFILCMLLSWKMPDVGAAFFSGLAWLQALPWLLDITENIILFSTIRPQPVKWSQRSFIAYRCLEIAKWGISLIGAVCGISSALYFWLAGSYSSESLVYFGIVVAEIVVFLVATTIAGAKQAP